MEYFISFHFLQFGLYSGTILSVLLDDVRLEEPEVELRRRTVENVAQGRLLRLLVRRYMAALSPSRGKRAKVEAPLTLDLMTRKIPNQSSRNLTREKARVSMSKKNTKANHQLSVGIDAPRGEEKDMKT